MISLFELIYPSIFFLPTSPFVETLELSSLSLSASSFANHFFPCCTFRLGMTKTDSAIEKASLISSAPLVVIKEVLFVLASMSDTDEKLQSDNHCSTDSLKTVGFKCLDEWKLLSTHTVHLEQIRSCLSFITSWLREKSPPDSCLSLGKGKN